MPAALTLGGGPFGMPVTGKESKTARILVFRASAFNFLRAG